MAKKSANRPTSNAFKGSDDQSTLSSAAALLVHSNDGADSVLGADAADVLDAVLSTQSDADTDDLDTGDTEGDNNADDSVGDETDDDEVDDDDDDDNNSDGDSSSDEDDNVDSLEVTDKDLISVTVDGEEVDVELGELKKAYALRGAAEKRLEEATTIRNEAHSAHTQTMETLATQQQDITSVLNEAVGVLNLSLIPEPPENLRHSDPTQYQRHAAAYAQDQERIAANKKKLEELLSKAADARTERLQIYGAKAFEVIRTEIPDLANPETKAATFGTLAKTAKHYGYSDAEIQTALDPRMFIIMRDLTELATLKGSQTAVTENGNKTGKRIKRLKTAGTTSRKQKMQKKEKQRQAAVAKAEKTGKVQDVAQTLTI